MSTNINQSDLDGLEDVLQVKALMSSRLSDTKDIFKHKFKEDAFFNRYGKRIKTSWTYDLEESGEQFSEYTMRVQSNHGKHYSVTEFMDGGLTDHVVLAYRKEGKNYKNRFNRFVDAELTLADLISEEKDG